MAISNPTPKQQRNGADTGAPGSGATMAKPGPDFTAQVASAKRSAENQQVSRKSRDHLARPESTNGPESYGRYVGGGS